VRQFKNTPTSTPTLWYPTKFLLALSSKKGEEWPTCARCLTSCAPGTATSCTINGESTINGQPVNGSTTVNPTQDTTYTLSCETNPGTPPPPPQTSTVNVTVQGPNVHEINP
jgi:hypothetical protein